MVIRKIEIRKIGFRKIGFRKNVHSENWNSEKWNSEDWIRNFGRLPIFDIFDFFPYFGLYLPFCDRQHGTCGRTHIIINTNAKYEISKSTILS